MFEQFEGPVKGIRDLIDKVRKIIERIFRLYGYSIIILNNAYNNNELYEITINLKIYFHKYKDVKLSCSRPLIEGNVISTVIEYLVNRYGKMRALPGGKRYSFHYH